MTYKVLCLKGYSRNIASYFLLFAAVALIVTGCASSSATERNSADERVSGQPPAPGQDTMHPLPKGPDVLTDSHAPRNQKPQNQRTDQTSANADAESVTRQDLNRLINKGPSFPLSVVEVEPARNGSKFIGHRVVSIAPVARPTLAGHLQKGDIITHLNGIRIDKPDAYLDAWKLLADISTIRIDFMRDSDAKHALWRVQ